MFKCRTLPYCVIPTRFPDPLLELLTVSKSCAKSISSPLVDALITLWTQIQRSSSTFDDTLHKNTYMLHNER